VLLGLAATIAAALSQAESIVSYVEKHFGTSPYQFLMKSYNVELACTVVVVMVGYHLLSGDFPKRYARWRLNWVSRPTPRLRLHPEEWALLVVVLALGAAFTAHSYFKLSRVYSEYGLHHVADRLCRGEFDEAVTRMKTLKANSFWEKYRSRLQSAVERSSHVKELLDRRLANFEADRERGSAEDLLAQAMELKVIFGSNAWRTLDARRDAPATNPWRQFLSEMKC
jgi:hypothetical protein